LREFPRLQIPQPITTQFATGVDDGIYSARKSRAQSTARLDLDGEELAEELFQAYLKQVLWRILPRRSASGKYFLSDDGRVALLDLGMVGRIAPGMQEHLLQCSWPSAKETAMKWRK